MKKRTKIKIWAFLMRLGNRSGCHQLEERSFFYKGWQFPVCARCTGILVGQIVYVLLYILGSRINIFVSTSFLAIMFLDWFLQYKNIKKSNNIRRLVTGILAGIAQISIMLELIIFSIQRWL